MAIDLLTNPGGLFPRLGRVLKVAYTLTPFEASLPALFDGILAQFDSSLQDVAGQVGTGANSNVRSASAVMGFAQSFASQVIQRMVAADVPSQSVSLQTAMRELIRQMEVSLESVKANTIGQSQVQLTGSVGSGVLVITTRRGDGLIQENSIAEELRLMCIADSYTGGVTEGQEQFGLGGTPVVTQSVWDYDYPNGSGASVQVTAVSADQDASTTGNLLTNGSFEDWTTDPAPELANWELEVGTWGTSIQRSAVPLKGAYSVQFNAGATLNSLYQEFNSAGGTAASPSGLRSYVANIWLRKLAGTISAGVLTIELVDDLGNVLNDAQGTPNSATVTLSTLGTSWTAHNVDFRLNGTPPDVVRLRFRVSTALAGNSFLMDSAVFALTTPFYVGGPSFVVLSGATPFVLNDGWTVTITNDQGGSSNLGTFQTGFDRLFDMKGLGLLLPSASGPTIPNTLITS